MLGANKRATAKRSFRSQRRRGCPCCEPITRVRSPKRQSTRAILDGELANDLPTRAEIRQTIIDLIGKRYPIPYNESEDSWAYRTLSGIVLTDSAIAGGAAYEAAKDALFDAQSVRVFVQPYYSYPLSTAICDGL